eukprot:15434910-Alexandrium_andersonii.AAC.1
MYSWRVRVLARFTAPKARAADRLDLIGYQDSGHAHYSDIVAFKVCAAMEQIILNRSGHRSERAVKAGI